MSLRRPYAFFDFLSGVPPEVVTALIGNSISIETKGFTIYTDPEDRSKGVSSSLRLYGTYDPEVTWIFEQLINHDSTVIDVGANIGWYTLVAARIAKKVISIEPEPRNFALLSKSVASNGFENVVLRKEAVSDHDGPINLYLNTRSGSGHSIVWTGPQSVPVNASTLDSLVVALDLRQIDLLKIDAESAEPLILRGLAKSLESGLVKCLIIEYSARMWSQDRGVLARLFELYSVYEFRRPVPLLTRLKSADRLPKAGQTVLVMERKPKSP